MEMSNKSLALILVLSVAVSLFGTFYSISRMPTPVAAPPTGYAASDTGQTNFTIQSDIQIVFTTSQINFGTGAVNNTDGAPTICENCTLNSEGTRLYNCSGFNVVNTGFRIENQGNLNVSLNISSNETVAQFVGGNSTVRAFQWKMEENETGACGAGLAPGTYSTVTVTNTTACTDFKTGAANTLNMEIQIRIPQNASTGTRDATITAWGYE